MGITRRSLIKNTLVTAAASFALPRVARAQSARRSVVVVGAGASGLAAARTLYDAGYDVLVVEGRTRLGGRIRTDRSLGVPVDLGAGWIHGYADNPLTPLSKKYGSECAFSDFQSVNGVFADGEKLPALQLLSLYGKVLGVLDGSTSTDESIASLEGRVRAAIDANALPAKDQQMLNAIMGGMMLEAGYEMDEIDWVEYFKRKTFTGGDYKFLNGYDTIPYGLARGLAVRTGAPVQRIALTKKGVRVDTACGAFDADFAVVTLPLGVLKKQSVTFEPGLPDGKLAAIDGLGMGLSEKVVLQFPKAFWPTDATIILRASDDKAYYPLFFNNHYPFTQDPILTARVAGSRVPAFNKMSDADAQGEVMDVLRQGFGNDIPEPTGMLRSDWVENPFTAGSYSTVKVGVPSQDFRAAIAAPFEERIFFAGEHTSPDRFSTVHGAYLSGLRAAEEIQALV